MYGNLLEIGPDTRASSQLDDSHSGGWSQTDVSYVQIIVHQSASAPAPQLLSVRNPGAAD